jgi:hypothetical protein
MYLLPSFVYCAFVCILERQDMHTKFQSGNQRGRNHLEDLRPVWKNNGSTDCKAVGCEDVDEIHLAQVTVQ